jgi:hypothetical protein
MSLPWNKDAWIMDMIRRRYLIVREDGSILRCVRADEDGNLTSTQYKEVVQQVHKPTGRVYFNVRWRGYSKSVLTNRVVALRFYPNPNNLPQVNHIDGNKENNAKSNLEWSSGSDNERHAHRTGLKSGRGSANSNAKLTPADVLAIRASQDVPIDQLCEKYGVKRSTIANVLARKTWSHI